MSSRVRASRPADLEQLAQLFDAYRSFYEQPSDLAASRSFIEERFECGDSVILVGEVEEIELVGFTQLYPSLSSVSMARIFVLNDLFVIPSVRRHGVARALMQAAHEHARAAGAVRVSLSTATNNHHAQALYESVGYQRDEVFHHYDLSLG